MLFINPWSYYQIHEPNKIPDLNPHSDKELIECLAGICGFIIASIIFALVTYFLFSFTVNEYIDGYGYWIPLWVPLLVLINCIVIYPILIILLMKLSFKIVDKIYKKKRK